MDHEVDIVVTGLDVTQVDAARGLVVAFDLSAAQAELFVRELPRVAKRRASESEAARYVAALRAIGVRVETQASEAPRTTFRGRLGGEGRDHEDPFSDHPPSILELPFDVPAEVPIRDVVMATRSLGMISNPPPETLNPSFPRAPLLPRDMHRLPNANIMLPSMRPEADDDTDPHDAPRRHTDAQMPPPHGPRVQAAPSGRGEESSSAPAWSPIAFAKQASAARADESAADTAAGRANDPSAIELAAKRKRRVLLGVALLIGVALIVVASGAFRRASQRRAEDPQLSPGQLQRSAPSGDEGKPP